MQIIVSFITQLFSPTDSGRTPPELIYVYARLARTHATPFAGR